MRAFEFLKEEKPEQLQKTISDRIRGIFDIDELNQIYSYIRKIDLGGGFDQIFSKDIDLKQVQSTLSKSIIDAKGSFDEKINFAKELVQIGIIDINKLLSPGITQSIDDVIVTKYPNIYQQIAPTLIAIEGSFLAGTKKTKKGKGEFFFALCSPQITLSKDKGDLMIGKLPIEVKDNLARLISRNGYGTTVQATADVAKDIEKKIPKIRNILNGQPLQTALGRDSNFWRTFGPSAIAAGIKPKLVITLMHDSMDTIVKSLYSDISEQELNAFRNTIRSNGELDWKAFTSVQKSMAFSYYQAHDQFAGILFINSDKQTVTYINSSNDFVSKIGVKAWGFYPKIQNAGLQVLTP